MAEGKRMLPLAIALVAGGLALAHAQQPIAFDSPANHFREVTREQYLADIEQMQALVASCKARQDACDAEKAGDDVTVRLETGRVDVRRGWLRNTLNEAKLAGDAARTGLMAQAADRLTEDAGEAAGFQAGAGTSGTNRARSEADAILSRPEFRSVEPEGWFDKKWAVLMLWLGVVWDGLFARLPHSSWVAPLLEWGLLVAAAVALIVWAWRVTQQQRLELAMPDGDRTLLWQKESEDWAQLARACAAEEDWREAVHCLYWAAIVMLEGRRFWRPNRARTPREYLPLLEDGSERRRALAGLTRLLERIWYGLRPAARRDFEQAQALLEELKAA